MSQLGNATNPLQMMMSLLTPSQKQLVSAFQNKTEQEQYEEVANLCKEKGIGIDDFKKIVNLFNKR